MVPRKPFVTSIDSKYSCNSPIPQATSIWTPCSINVNHLVLDTEDDEVHAAHESGHVQCSGVCPDSVVASVQAMWRGVDPLRARELGSPLSSSSSLPPGLAVCQHGGSLLQAVGGAIPCLALDTHNLAIKGPDNIINTILVMKIQILVHFHF